MKLHIIATLACSLAAASPLSLEVDKRACDTCKKVCPDEQVCITLPKGCRDICVVPRFCGGIAGIQCDDGFICIDYPNDGCDPENGGNDCGGICIPGRG
ncbi:hypothetical protein QBC34DRAFT_406275 [Podospora aff. communis PSN243]|uniref:Uncharacterized protein n=1 Tax=Podospora aff. communis PSN243 TaxID=3040156 RepID=A0AAV9GLP1_9PEZI|nr:hypothetical protein QBC34DRAFT_406275 [Podospora aff. communis PSN243]